MPTRTSTGPLWQQAAAFSARMHAGQVRKDNITPYASHPARVAFTIACLFGFADDEELIAAALLHDTIEDTTADYDDLLERFGRNVADWVALMTKDMRLPESQREKVYDRQLAEGAWQGRALKLADAYDNLCDASDNLDAQARRKRAKKAQRALKLAQGDANLKQASRLLAERIKAVLAGKSGGSSGRRR